MTARKASTAQPRAAAAKCSPARAAAYRVLTLLTYPQLIEIVRARSDDDGGCWIWRGAYNGHDRTSPVLYYRGHSCALRRAIVSVRMGRLLGRKEVATTSCGTRGCVNPEHIKHGTKREIAHRNQAGSRRRADVRLRMAAATRAAHAKLTEDDVEEIRDVVGMTLAELVVYLRQIPAEIAHAYGTTVECLELRGGLRQRDIAHRYGVTQQAISRIVTGDLWRPAPAANPWTGLMRRVA